MLNDWQNWMDDNLSSPWIHLAIALVLGMLAGFIAAGILQRLGKRSKRKLITGVANNLRSVAFVICTLIGINFGLQAFDFRPATLLKIGNSFTFAIFLLATWALTNIYASIHEQLITPWAKKTENTSLADVGHTVVNILIWLIGLISGLSSAGFDVAAVLAGLGIGGLAIALAAQDAVANIFGGVVILTQAPFKVGNKITITGTTGWVTNIGIRATTIMNWYGHILTFPNKIFTNNPVANVDARTEYWEELPLKLRHDTTLAQVKTTIARVEKILTDHKHLRDNIWVGVCKFGDGYIEIEVWYGIISYLVEGGDADFPNEYAKILSVKSEIHLQILGALEEEGIRLATPVATHVQHQGPFETGRF